jgi:hypothetical protein
MNTKERDAVFQHWRSVILRETRDLASLEQVGARALQDREVRADATLESLIRADLEQRRAEIEREQQGVDSAARQPRPTVRRSAYVGRRTTSLVGREPRPESRSVPPAPVPPPPAPAQVAFDCLAQALSGWLQRNDESEARAVWEQMRAFQQESRGVIPPAALQPYEQQVAKLRTRLEHFRDQVAALVQQAVAASRQGDEQDVAKLMRRLTAIHVTHPRLLDEAQLEQIRADIVHANEEHQDGLTARKLVERERVVAAEIEKVAAAVHEFYRVVCAVPDTSAEFRAAEATYLRALEEVRAHDTEWLTGFVLELGDLLAEWTEPPLTAAKRIDHFLESIRLSLKGIHAEMGNIDSKRAEGEGA